jgi:hypothetical protein
MLLSNHHRIRVLGSNIISVVYATGRHPICHGIKNKYDITICFIYFIQKIEETTKSFEVNLSKVTDQPIKRAQNSVRKSAISVCFLIIFIRKRSVGFGSDKGLFMVE